MNRVVEELIVELNRSMFGEPWYGASLKTILDGIESQKAFIKESGNNHSIAEIALHILAWHQEILSRLMGNNPKEPSRGDWPLVKSTENSYWEEIKENIYTTHREIISIIENLPIELFETKIGNEHLPQLATGFTFRESLIGLMQHNVYHGGQISLLKTRLASNN